MSKISSEVISTLGAGPSDEPAAEVESLLSAPRCSCKTLFTVACKDAASNEARGVYSASWSRYPAATHVSALDLPVYEQATEGGADNS
jgi:hypothetical protein